MSHDTKEGHRMGATLVFCERIEPSAEQVEDLDTARVVASFQAGDRDAFARLYQRYFDRVYGYLRVALKDAHEAEDLTQQVFLKVVEALPAYRYEGKPFRAWLFRIVRNHALTLLGKRDRLDLIEPAALDQNREGAELDGSQLSALNWITDQDLLVFIGRLPDAQRQALALRYMLDLSNLQIAEILGRSANDVAVLQRRGLAFLRDRLLAVGRHPKLGSTRGGRSRMRGWNPQAPVLRHRRFALFS